MRVSRTGEEQADHMHRFAISELYSKLLTREQMRTVLSESYDPISNAVEAAMGPPERPSSLLLNLHTYDPKNDGHDGTERPHISLIYTPIGYDRERRMPFNVFDPAYPDELAETTADPKLISRIVLTFASIHRWEYEAALGEEWDGHRFRVGANLPYKLPDGSLEVRSAVWMFFRFVQQRYEKHLAEEGRLLDDDHRTALNTVWKMLLDTNLRDSRSVALRSYLHMIRKPPTWATLTEDESDGSAIREVEREYARIEDVYDEVVDFIRSGDVVKRYRRDPRRFSALAIEVRKDLVWKRHYKTGRYLRARGYRQRTAEFIVQKLEEAVRTYIEEDARSNEGWLDD